MIQITVCPKGQIVIPADVRGRLGIHAGTRLELIEENGELRLKVLRSFNRANLAELAGMFKAPSRGTSRSLDDYDLAATMRVKRRRDDAI
jgi:AbrB family looped-hinge helix DNA binding protein